MKIMTILGTRPEIIRLSRVVEKLDKVCTQVIVHTGQNYDPNLNDIFFKQLGVRAPDHYLGAQGSFGEQIGTILAKMEKLMLSERPDKFLVLGDTNSSMAAIMAKRLAIKVYHMEAGNRCYDDRVPEEVNRRIIDHSSDILLPYTERSRQNLLAEGIPGERIYVTGNPIKEVLDYYGKQIDSCGIIKNLGLKEGAYFLVTLHRAENVDIPSRLKDFVEGLNALNRKYKMPVIWSVHPRTRNRLKADKTIKLANNVRPLDPLGLFEFVKLEKNAKCVLTDSGTVQEETCIFNVPNITLRDVTERPETLEAGSNVISGANPEDVLRCTELVLGQKSKWAPPPEYLAENVSDKVVRIVTGYLWHGY